jgi:ABC-type glycerol-3-phosphate transport system substrate-binding protein
MRKVSILFLVIILVANTVFGGGKPQPSAGATPRTTLKIIGSNTFSTTGPDGTIDAITGRELPGYKMIVDAWQKIHPDVELEIEANPAPNWQAALQTGVLAGGVDILLHGASMVDLSMPLNDRIANDSQWAVNRLAYSVRRNPVLGPLENFYITGVPVTVNAMLVFINKDILTHYNVNLPDTNWTWDDLASIAKTCTGTDPVTRNRTYGIQFVGAGSNSELRKNFSLIGYGIGATPTIRYGADAKSSRVSYNDLNAMRIWNIIGELTKYISPVDREGIDVSMPADNLDIAIYFSEGAANTYNQLKDRGVLNQYLIQNLPRVTSGELKGSITPFMGDSNMSICKTSTQQDLAWEWIKFCTENEAAIRYFTECGGMVNHKIYSANLSQIVPQELVDIMRRSLAVIPDTYSPSTGMFQNNVNFGNLDNNIGTGIRMLMMGSGSANEAAASVQQGVDEYVGSLN